MWMETNDTSTMIKGDYVFVTVKTDKTVIENQQHGDMILVDNPGNLSTEAYNDGIYTKCVQEAAENGSKDPEHVNLFDAVFIGRTHFCTTNLRIW